MRYLTIFCLSLLPACGDDPANAKDESGTLRIVATTGMVADLGRNVGGDLVTVEALMGPGVDPHLYQATPSDLKKLRAADVVLFNGKGLEGKMGDVLHRLAKTGKKVSAVTERIKDSDLVEDEPHHLDPHVWFDVALWSRCAAVVGETLAAADPANADTYRKNAESYATMLREELHVEVRARIATIPKERRVLITSHDAFRYFGRAYDMEVRGLQGISTASMAGVKDVEKMIDLIVNRKIKAVFVESSVSPKAIEAVRDYVRRRGHSVVIGGELFSDAMGDTPETSTYPGMIRHNVETLVGALK
ncbi:MAG: metal ABC transporter solute-binding protein, Zn/Mn family [Planctomycetota bacterium]|jgi:manganese/zinc/iron transport system substrate-binding protein